MVAIVFLLMGIAVVSFFAGLIAQEGESTLTVMLAVLVALCMGLIVVIYDSATNTQMELIHTVYENRVSMEEEHLEEYRKLALRWNKAHKDDLIDLHEFDDLFSKE